MATHGGYGLNVDQNRPSRDIWVRKNDAQDLVDVVNAYALEREIKFRGTYVLTKDVVIPAGSDILIDGKFSLIDVSGGFWFKFQAGDFNRGLIKNLRIDAKAALAVKGIDSEALTGTSQVLDDWMFQNVRTYGFSGAGSIPLAFKNFERGSISGLRCWDNISDQCRIKFTSDADAGNIEIFDFFMTGAGTDDIPQILLDATDGAVGGLHIHDGQFHSLNTKRGLGVKAYANGNDVERIWIHDCRGEYCGLYVGAGANDVKGVLIHDCDGRDDDASAIGIDAHITTKRLKAHNNILNYANGYAWKDANVQSDDDYRNSFLDNEEYGSISPSAYTIFRTAQKDSGLTANWRIDTTKIGRGVSATVPTSPATMAVLVDWIWMSITGGTGVTIDIKDYAGNTISTGATFVGWLKRNQKVVFTYTGAPTVVAYIPN